jgi:single-strand DNA-binding protein
MANLNQVCLIGRLTRDAGTRITPSGQPVTSFSLATNRYASGPDGEREFTDYHNIVAWNIGKRTLADEAAALRKGAQVYVEGRLRTRSWVTQDGSNRYRSEVVIHNLIVPTTAPELKRRLTDTVTFVCDGCNARSASADGRAGQVSALGRRARA